MIERFLTACCLAAAATVACAQTSAASSPARKIAEFQPAECLSAIWPTVNDVAERWSLRLILDRAGQQRHLSATWAPGGAAYDHALKLEQDALTSAKSKQGTRLAMSPEDYVEEKFSQLTLMRRNQVAAYLKSASGHRLWRYVVDDETCLSMLDKLEQSTLLTQDQLKTTHQWRARLAQERQSFESENATLPLDEQLEFDDVARDLRAPNHGPASAVWMTLWNERWSAALRPVLGPIWPEIEDLMKQSQVSERGG